MRWVAVCDADELWVGEMFAYAVEGRAVLLARLQDGFHAVADRCPHQDVSLSEGELAGGVLTCRAHRWEFDLASGRGLNPATARLARHAVRVEDGRVLVSAEPVPVEPVAA